MENEPARAVEYEIVFVTCMNFDDEFYGSMIDNGLVVKMNLTSGKCKLTEMVNRYDPIKWSIAIGYGRYKDNIFLLEDNCRRIAVYSKKNGSVSFIRIEGRTYAKHQLDKCLITSLSNRLFIFPCFNDDLIIIDMESQNVEKMIHLYPWKSYQYTEDYRETLVGTYPYPMALFSHAVRVDSEVYLFSHVLSEVVKFSLISLRSERVPIEGEYKYIVDVTYRNKLFYILDAWGDVYVWKVGYSKMKLFIPTDHNVDGYYNRVLATDKNIWILPGWGEDIRVVDLYTYKSMVYKNFPKNFHYHKIDRFCSKYSYGCDDDNKYFLANISANYVLVVNKKTGREEWIYPRGIGGEEIEHLLCGMGVHSPCNEEKNFGLRNFINYKSKRCILTSMEERIGNKIWDNISDKN